MVPLNRIWNFGSLLGLVFALVSNSETARAATIICEWKLNGNVNATTGGVNLTEAIGAPLSYSASVPTVLAGTQAQSGNFSDDTLTASLPALNTASGSPYSVSLWINDSDLTVSNLETLFVLGTAFNNSNLTGVTLRLDFNGLQFGQNTGTNETFLSVPRTVFSNNTWTNIVAVNNGSNSTVYVNGVSQGTVNITVGTTTDFRLGTRNGVSSPNQYTGLMADVQIYQGALSSTEATYIFATGIPEPSTALLLLGGLGRLSLQRRRPS